MLSSPALYRLACFCRHLNSVQYHREGSLLPWFSRGNSAISVSMETSWFCYDWHRRISCQALRSAHTTICHEECAHEENIQQFGVGCSHHHLSLLLWGSGGNYKLSAFILPSRTTGYLFNFPAFYGRDENLVTYKDLQM